MAEIRIDFKSTGGSQTLKELNAIASGAKAATVAIESLAKAQQAQARANSSASGAAKGFDDLARSAKQAADQVSRVSAPRIETRGIVTLANALGLSYQESQKFAQSLGLTGAAAGQAAQRFQQLRAAGASNVEIYRRLQAEFGLTAGQVRSLNTAFKSFAQSQQKPFADASKTIADLTLQIGKAKAALATGSNAQQISKENALFAEQLRSKRQLQQISNAGFSPQDAANARALAAELNKLNLEKINKDFNQLGTSARAGLGFLAAGAAAAASAVGSLFTEGVRQFVEFDGAVRQAGVISGGTAEQVEVLRKEITRLGIVTSKTPAEIARTSVNLARAGFTAEEVATSLEGIVRASEATGESLEVVGDIIGKTIRAFGLTARQSGEVADLLVQTANRTNTSIQGLGESLKFVGPAAAGSNQSLSDTLVLLGLLGDAGIQGTSAGTGLAEALQRLKTASAGVDTQFVGLVRGQKGATQAFAALQVAVRNTDGSMKSVLDSIPQIKSALAGFSREDQDVLTKALFGTQGGRVFQTLINASPERIARVRQEIENSQGVAKESGQALLQGLSGAFALLEGSVGATLVQFGALAAKGLEPLVRLATNVLNTFLGWPPAFQQALIAVTGLAGAIAAATAVTLAYKAANGALIVEQIKEAALLVKTTALTFLKNTATNAAIASQSVLATVLRRATAEQQAQAAAIGGSIAKYGLVAAAIGSVALAFEALQSSANANRDLIEGADRAQKSLQKLRNSLVELNNETEGSRSIDEVVAGNLEALTQDINPVLKFIDQIREGLNSLPEPLKNFIAAFNPILAVLNATSTETERAVDRQSQEFGKLTDAAEGSLQTYEQLISEQGGLAGRTSTELDNLAGSIQDSITELENSNPALKENIVARERYLTSLRAAQAEVQKTIDATKAQDAVEGDTTAIDERTEAIKKAVEERQRAAKEAADDQRADDERALSRQLDDERQARQLANQAEIAAQQKQDAEAIAQIEKANAQIIADLEKQNQLELQSAEQTFERAIAQEEERRQAEFQDREQRFQRNQQQEAANFSANQRRLEEEFRNRLSDRTQAQDESFTNAERLIALRGAQDAEERRTIQEQARVAREIQNLDLADQILPPARLAQLAQSIAGVGTIDNQEEAQRVQEVLGQIQEEQRRQQQEADRQAELALQAQLQAQEAAFTKQQQGEQQAFEASLNDQKKALEAEIEQRKLEFETNVLTPLREQLEARITALREQQEQQIALIKEQQEAELEQRRRDFEASERQLDREAEDERIRRDREYRAQQRQLDLDNAAEVARILAGARDAQGNDTSFTPRGLRKGGTFEAGEPVRLHRDEYVIPSVGGRVVSQVASKAIARQAAQAQAIKNLPSMANYRVGSPPVAIAANRETDGQMKTMAASLRNIERLLKDRPAPQMALTQNFPVNSPQIRREAASESFYWLRKQL